MVYEDRVKLRGSRDWTWSASVWVLQHLEWTVAIVIACVPNLRVLISRAIKRNKSRTTTVQVASLDADNGSISPASARFSRQSKAPLFKGTTMDSILELEHVDYRDGRPGSADIDIEAALRMEFKEIKELKEELHREALEKEMAP